MTARHSDHLSTARPGSNGRHSRAGTPPPPHGPPAPPGERRAAAVRLERARGAIAAALAAGRAVTAEERRAEVQALVGVFEAEGGRRAP